MSNANFNGLRVLALESRRAREIAQLITNCGGDPVVAPSGWRWLRLKTFGTDPLQDSLGHLMHGVGRRAPVTAA